MDNHLSHKVCIAPMMDYTNTHFRYFLRHLSKNIFLYTEMISADAIIHGNRDKLLKYHQIEHPIALQIGGSNIEKMTEASLIGENYGYDEVNLNIGCPSPRVQSGNFGACLMTDVKLVSEIITSIKNKVKIPVTVKCRLGVDDQDIDKELPIFISSIIDAGVDLVIIHARKAWLNGISPKENRTLPEIDYEKVYNIKNNNPDIPIIINGEIKSYTDIENHLNYVDGVMLGRKVMSDPLFFYDVDPIIFGEENINSINDIIDIYSDYADKQTQLGVSKSQIIKPLLSLFNNKPNAKNWRRGLDKYRNSDFSAFKFISSLHKQYLEV
ncbi:MAG: tRNA dihydrouridine(20/20a) synthase DusA [Rhodobiaceae bacterium]|nr:tRNA dihydrouridine(20/20a) synthase DusA [Rhodobiaceae bacterium]RPF97136.1 MAG: tRNA dihydrouridine(20/20a) synthase DusA [Rhizobiales bacterium TMED227]